MNIKQEITNYSKTIDIEAIGFCQAKEMDDLIDHYKYRDIMGYRCDLEKMDNVEKRSIPQLTLENAKTFIVILESYSIHEKSKSIGHPNGFISKASNFEDYHKILYSKLNKLQQFLVKRYGCNCRYYCDISPFSDRELARRAGLGVIGKNSFLINKKFGTATYIGYILTDLVMNDYDIPIQEDYCKTCNTCVKACPNHAIIGDKQINSNKCISYLTQAKSIPKGMRYKMNNNIYGCDICQIVCPYNKDTENKTIEPIIDSTLDIASLLSISNAEFKKTYGKASCGWRGKKMLQRNAIIALGNQKNDESVELLRKYSNDQREDVRLEVVRALINIDKPTSKAILQDLCGKEKNKKILEVIKKYFVKP